MVPTMVFPQAEFYCICCGLSAGFLDAIPKDPTKPRLKKLAKFEREWDENVSGKLLVPGVYRTGCSKCNPLKREHHEKHASKKEQKASEEALKWISNRARALPNKKELAKLFLYIYQHKPVTVEDVCVHMIWPEDLAERLIKAMGQDGDKYLMESRRGGFEFTMKGMETCLQLNPKFHDEQLEKFGITEVTIPVSKLKELLGRR